MRLWMTIVSKSPLVNFVIEILLHWLFARLGGKNWLFFSIFWLFDPFFELRLSPTQVQCYWTRRGESACKKLFKKNVYPIWDLGDQFSRKNEFLGKTPFSFDFFGVVIRDKNDCRQKVMGVNEVKFFIKIKGKVKNQIFFSLFSWLLGLFQKAPTPSTKNLETFC